MATVPAGYVLQPDGTYKSIYSGVTYTSFELGIGIPADLQGNFPWFDEIPALASSITQWLIDGVTADQIPAKVRSTPEYLERFPGMAMRKGNKLNPISEAEYLALERAYYQQFHEFGLYDYIQPSTFRASAAQLIGQDISVQEVNSRLDWAFAAVFDNGREMKDAFQAFYGVNLSDQTLASYFLDPTRGLADIEDQVLTAQVGGEALRFGLSVTRNRADELRRAGITQQLAREGYSDVANEMPTLQRLATIHAFAPLGQEQLEEFFFHQDPLIGKRRSQIFARSLAEFEGSISGRRSQQGGIAELLAGDQTF